MLPNGSLLNKPRLRLSVSCFVLAFCSLNYEFLLAQMMAILGGHTVLFYCLTTGVYIFALGLGALVPVDELARDRVEAKLFRVEMTLCILGGGSPLWLTLMSQSVSALWQGAAPPMVTLMPHGALVIAIGVLSGMELPLLMRLGELAATRATVTKLLVIDYLASFVGALSFPLVLFPALGMVRAGALLAQMNLYAVLLSVPVLTKSRRMTAVAAAAAAVLVIYWQGDGISRWLSHYL
ncbi:MAG: hypothetical protein FJ146_15040 [Deltaproteobacteria bacterium]|nr:hypothetical protein [Deltaproteobacteria bacterium]